MSLIGAQSCNNLCGVLGISKHQNIKHSNTQEIDSGAVHAGESADHCHSSPTGGLPISKIHLYTDNGPFSKIEKEKKNTHMPARTPWSIRLESPCKFYSGRLTLLTTLTLIDP